MHFHNQVICITSILIIKIKCNKVGDKDEWFKVNEKNNKKTVHEQSEDSFAKFDANFSTNFDANTSAFEANFDANVSTFEADFDANSSRVTNDPSFEANFDNPTTFEANFDTNSNTIDSNTIDANSNKFEAKFDNSIPFEADFETNNNTFEATFENKSNEAIKIFTPTFEANFDTNNTFDAKFEVSIFSLPLLSQLIIILVIRNKLLTLSVIMTQTQK